MPETQEEKIEDGSSLEETREEKDEIIEDQDLNIEQDSSDDSSGEALETEMEVSEIDILSEENDKLKTELAELKDSYLRKQADFENFRKRMIRDKEDAIKFGNSNLLLDLVAIIDDFERAIKSSEESKDYDSFHAGIELIEKRFVGMLEKNYGLKRFDSAGEPFDPQMHEALMMEDSDKYDVETVLEDFQKGYTLHDRVLRNAKVKVSRVVGKKSGKEK